MCVHMGLCKRTCHLTHAVFFDHRLSEHARIHLGLYDAILVRPLCVGDSMRAFFKVDSIEYTPQHSIIDTTHITVNQNDELVFSIRKKTMFSPDLNLTHNERVPPEISVRSNCEIDCGLFSVVFVFVFVFYCCSCCTCCYSCLVFIFYLFLFFLFYSFFFYWCLPTKLFCFYP